MKKGDIVELIEDMSIYNKGTKAHFIRTEAYNPNNAQVVWFGEEDAYREWGDVEVVPISLLQILETE